MNGAPVSPPERMPDIRVTVMAADANPYGTAFVGWLFGQMSLAGGSLASRRTGKRAPVVAADGFKPQRIPISISNAVRPGAFTEQGQG
jgi:acyl-CoA thioesterase YciA